MVAISLQSTGQWSDIRVFIAKIFAIGQDVFVSSKSMVEGVAPECGKWVGESGA